MDILSLLGVILGFATVFFAMILKHIPFSALANPAAMVVIFVGTFASLFIATPMADFKNIGALLGVTFGKQRFIGKIEAINKLIEYSKLVRKEGLLSLETRMTDEKDPFLARGLQLLMDGTDSSKVEEYLWGDVEAMEQRHAGNAQIFSQAGSYAPTLGVLGAVMGLISALGDLSDMDRLSDAISAAFIATVLGIFTGYVLWNPIANKLKRKSQLEVQTKTLIIEGLSYIAQGVSPSVVEENLMSHITQKERKKVTKG